MREMRYVAFGTTASRSVLGTMNDYVNHIEWAFHDRADVTLHMLSLELADTPVSPLGYERPMDVVRRCLAR
ncbi:MAG: hypothetical protein HY048_19980 [Acidobacteria bacterium]|nr:hypothetical protein [Acidobacteriota bacterium]